MGLTAGPVPPRGDAHVKAGLLELAAHARVEGGWSLRQAAAALGLEHARLLRWQHRAALDRLDDARPGLDVPAHALLEQERAAIVKIAEDWAAIDRSHRKLAHRGSRLGLFYASESTVLRVLVDEGVHLPERPAREPRDKRPFPRWAELAPGVIFIYDFTHFRVSKRRAVAVVDVVSRKWLSTVVSAEESSPRSRSPSPGRTGRQTAHPDCPTAAILRRAVTRARLRCRRKRPGRQGNASRSVGSWPTSRPTRRRGSPDCTAAARPRTRSSQMTWTILP